MKYIIELLLMAIVIAVSSNRLYAQNTQENSDLTRKEKKAIERERLHGLNKEMLESRSFVLESHYLQNRYGVRIPVNSTINFVRVNGEEAVVQIGSDAGLGHNGVGGVTAKGRITKWVLKENEKNRTFDLKMNILTSIGMYDITMNIGNYRASARLTGLRPGNLTFSGDMVALEESVIYEGRSL